MLKHPGEGLHLDIFSKLSRARNFVDEVKTEFKLYENTFCTAVASEVSQEMAETLFFLEGLCGSFRHKPHV
jgi:predicted translin family RNA/ssDNA-binding protein